MLMRCVSRGRSASHQEKPAQPRFRYLSIKSCDPEILSKFFSGFHDLQDLHDDSQYHQQSTFQSEIAASWVVPLIKTVRGAGRPSSSQRDRRYPERDGKI